MPLPPTLGNAAPGRIAGYGAGVTRWRETKWQINGGTRVGSRCLVHTFQPGDLHAGVAYWVDADPRWPGVFYAKINNGCPFGGAGLVNCQILGFAGDVLEQNVGYVVDAAANPPGVYYPPDFLN